jgi:hypothetical protein
MLLTVKEMELLCVFHDGTLSSTLNLLQRAEAEGKCPPERLNDLNNLNKKLSQLKDGDRVCISF